MRYLLVGPPGSWGLKTPTGSIDSPSEVIHATGTDEALAFVHKGCFDLVLWDPAIPGLETFRESLHPNGPPVLCHTEALPPRPEPDLQAKQRWNLHLHQTPLAVIEWDIEGYVRNWNPAAEQMFGYSAEEAIGQLIIDLIVPQKAEVLEQVHQIARVGEVPNLRDEA